MTVPTTQRALSNHEGDDTATQHSVKVTLVSQQEPPRQEIERFIRAIFRRAYGANVRHLPPHLLSMRQDGRILAALGIRPAKEAPLFLENYLEKPIECTLAEHLKHPIERNRIVEIGNLASAHGGGARALIITLTAYLSGAGYDWAVFTATPQVRNNFTRLGIELTPLIVADKTRLGDAQCDWGSYYDQAPVVVACNVKQGAAAILTALNEQRLFSTARQLWDDAMQAGRLGCLWQPPRTLDTQWPEWMLPTMSDFKNQ